MPSSKGTNGGGGSSPESKFNKVLTDEDRRRILRERAKMLARREEQKSSTLGESIYVFEYILAGETFSFDTKFVREVLSAKKVATVPCTPPFVSGVLNVRGEIITVLDTKMLFGLQSQGIAPQSKIIVVSNGLAQMGFLVDGVIGIAEVAKQDLQPPLSTISPQQARYIAGITKAPMILIDLDALMNDPGIVVDEEVE